MRDFTTEEGFKEHPNKHEITTPVLLLIKYFHSRELNELNFIKTNEKTRSIMKAGLRQHVDLQHDYTDMAQVRLFK